MSVTSKKFLIDTNSLITPYKQFYAFDFQSRFWIHLEEKIKDGSIVILDLVKDELTKVPDDLGEWIKNITSLSVINHRSQNIIGKYSEIISYISSCGYYKQSALSEWGQATVADPWLIATAAVHNYDLITFEVTNGPFNVRNPVKKAKIPDICSQFNVGCFTLYEMMRQLQLKI